MKLPEGNWISVAEFSGRYTGEQSTVYARCVKAGLEGVARKPLSAEKSDLQRLAAGESKNQKCNNDSLKQVCFGSKPEPDVFINAFPKVFMIAADGIVAVDENEPQGFSAGDQESEEVLLARAEETKKASAAADLEWAALAKAKDWDQVKADLSVYQYSGETVAVDPRRSEDYRNRVADGCGFAVGQTRAGLTEADMKVAREVVKRKAAAFWLEDSPRTTVRFVKHDTVPTGPPCRTPPHNLKGEAAEWIDDQLEKEVKRGQLERGSSPWGSPPFPTKDFAEHKKQRKRRMVIDYRRVNSRTLRAIYYLRRAGDVISEAAGSVWLTLLDAVTGFNLIVNTQRARRMLAIMARSGQFLPRCLTFGPHNGPEDFGFVVDRVFSPGRKSKRRFCKEWLAYVDDVTIRTGRVIDGLHLTDEEAAARVRAAVNDLNSKPNRNITQTPLDALKALGFDASGLSSEKQPAGLRLLKERPATSGEQDKAGITVASGSGGSRLPFA